MTYANSGKSLFRRLDFPHCLGPDTSMAGNEGRRERSRSDISRCIHFMRLICKVIADWSMLRLHLMSSILCLGRSAIIARGTAFAGFDARSGRVPVTLRGISARNTASGLLPPVLLTRKTRWSPAQGSLLRRLRSGRVFPFRRCRVSRHVRTPCRPAGLASRSRSSHCIRARLSAQQPKP